MQQGRLGKKKHTHTHLPNYVAHNGSTVETDSDIDVTFAGLIFVNQNFACLVDQVNGKRRNILRVTILHVSFEICDPHVCIWRYMYSAQRKNRVSEIWSANTKQSHN